VTPWPLDRKIVRGGDRNAWCCARRARAHRCMLFGSRCWFVSRLVGKEREEHRIFTLRGERRALGFAACLLDRRVV
jgi:hypothetical protein